MFNTRCNFKWGRWELTSCHDFVIAASATVSGMNNDRNLEIRIYMHKWLPDKHAVMFFDVDGEIDFVTGGGDAFIIMSAVLQGMKELHEYRYSELTNLPISSLKSLRFAVSKYDDSENPDRATSGRIKLYKRLADKFAPDYGYSVIVESTENPDTVLFTLERKGDLQ